MESKSDLAVAKHLSGYNCAQSVIYPFHKELHIEADTALKLSCGFGGGMGRKQEVCGAVTGGIMVLGARYGRGEHDERPATEFTYGKVRELMDRFSETHGTFLCRQLLHGCDLTTEEGQKQYKERDYQHTVCAKCVQNAVEIVDSMIK
jgi:C_GCAxxG_C_C family probable redox protein